MNSRRGFTLVELLTVIAIFGMLSALLLPALHRAKEAGRRTACAKNLRQVNLAIRLYADDWADLLPVLPSPNPYPNGVGAYYRQLVKGYLGLSGPAAINETVFVCPSDRAIFRGVQHAFTSYTYNGYEVGPGSLARITGQQFSAIRNPIKAVAAAEWPAFFGGSWHPFQLGARPDAISVMAFTDGHVATEKVYWNGVPGTEPRDYEPPAHYAYSWSGE